MIDWLEHIDREILFFINDHHTAFLDELMWIISGKLTWVPLYVLVAYFIQKRYGWKGVGVFALGIIACIALADFISFRFIKNVVERYRPSHNLEIQDHLHYYLQSNGKEYRGGLYGFVSSHAANFFAIGTWCIMLIGKNIRWLVYTIVIATVLVVYSRVYLGVHYPSDILGGAILGTIIGFIIGKLGVAFLQRKST